MFIFLDSNLFRNFRRPRRDGGGDNDASRPPDNDDALYPPDDDDASSPPDESRDRLLLGVLDLFHSLMRRVSDVVRGALEVGVHWLGGWMSG